MVCEAVRDARGAIVAFPFQENQRAYLEELPARVWRWLTHFEAILGASATNQAKLDLTPS